MTIPIDFSSLLSLKLNLECSFIITLCLHVKYYSELFTFLGRILLGVLPCNRNTGNNWFICVLAISSFSDWTKLLCCG